MDRRRQAAMLTTNANLIQLINGGRRGSRLVRVRRTRCSRRTPAQASRLDRALYRMPKAPSDASGSFDPTWQPAPALRPQFRSVEDAIAERESITREAEGRLAELQRGRIGDNNGPPLLPRAPRGFLSSQDLESFRGRLERTCRQMCRQSCRAAPSNGVAHDFVSVLRVRFRPATLMYRCRVAICFTGPHRNFRTE